MTTLRSFFRLERERERENSEIECGLEKYRRRSEKSNWKKDKEVVVGRLKILHEKLALVYMSSEIGYIFQRRPPRFRKVQTKI